MEIKICHLYPDVLNLYGDRGNIRCLVKRLEWRGIDTLVKELPIGVSEDLSQYDLFFIGGGQDFEQEVLLDDLRKGKAEEIKKVIEDDKVFLAICGGYQMLGNYYQTWDGHRCDFIGAVDFYTLGAQERMIGNYMFQCLSQSGGSTVVGFENHSGKTYLGQGVSPLGRIIKGFGNNGEDGGEGIRYKNVFGTYSHGPVLPKNPLFADMILETALNQKYPDYKITELDDTCENTAHEYMENRLRG